MTAPPDQVAAALVSRYPGLKPREAEQAAALLVSELARVIRSGAADGFIQPLPDGWIEISRTAIDGTEGTQETREL